MCGRYVATVDFERIEIRFNVAIPNGYEVNPNFNVSAGDVAPIITMEDPGYLGKGMFGFTPSWAKKKMYMINARTEGDHNPENDPKYKGAKGIISKPFWRSAIRNKRCIIVADAFIEGTTKEKLSDPYLVYLINKQRPFGMAGLYDDWVDQDTGEILRTFAIITCPANSLMAKIPHHRMPVILDPSDYRIWLEKDIPLNEVTNLLRPYDHKLMNAYPISNEIKNPRNKGIELIKPLGEPLQKEFKIEPKVKLELQGMGMTPSRRSRLQSEGKWDSYLEAEKEIEKAWEENRKNTGKN